ncbi:unnamed protein product [Prunus armeniaca]
MHGVPKKLQGASRTKFWAFRADTAWYNLVLPAVSGLSRPWSHAGFLWSNDPEGAALAGLEVATGPAACRSVALSVGPSEQGVQPLRPSRAALGKRRRFGRDAYVSLLERPNCTEGGILMETTTLLMVKWSDRSDRVVVTKFRSRRLGQDGRGRLRRVLGRISGPWDTWGCSAPMIRPKHGVGRASFFLGRWVQDLPASVGIAPAFWLRVRTVTSCLGVGRHYRHPFLEKRLQFCREFVNHGHKGCLYPEGLPVH